MNPDIAALRLRLANDPADADALHSLRRALEETGDLRGAAEALEHAADQRADGLTSASLWSDAATLRDRLSEPDRAYRDAERAIELDPRNAPAGALYVRLARQSQDVHRVIDSLGRWVVRLREANAAGHERGEAELATARAWAALPGRLDKAVEHYLRAVEVDPELAPSLDEAVELAKKARRTLDVRALLEAAAMASRVPTRRVELLVALAEARAAVPVDLDGAIDALRVASRESSSPEPIEVELMARLRARRDRNKGTAQASADAHTLADLHVTRSRRTEGDARLRELEAALDIAPRHTGALEAYDATAAQRAETPARIKRLAAAIEGDTTPESFALRQRLASLLSADGRPAEAFDAVRPGFGNPFDVQTAATFAGYAVAAGRFADALPLLERAYHGWDASYRARAFSDVMEKAHSGRDLEAAGNAAALVLAIAPHDARALAVSTEAHVASGKVSEAIHTLERRISLSEDRRTKAELLRALVALHDQTTHDTEAATDAFQRLAELDPRDRGVREELITRLTRANRPRALATVRAWEAAHLETREERSLALDALLALHQATPLDAALVASALTAYRAAEPTDVRARDALIAYYDAAGELTQAALLLDESVRAAPDAVTRLTRLDALADLAEHRLRDDERARAAARYALETSPTHQIAIERLERLAVKSGLREHAIEATSARVQASTGLDRKAQLVRLSELHESPPGNLVAAIAAREEAWSLDSSDDVLARDLLRLYRQAGRHTDASRLLDELASAATAPEARVTHLRARAHLLRDDLGDDAGAAACFRAIRETREDEEALGALISFTRQNGLHAELSYLLATRLGATLDVAESIELGLERATVLLDHLADPREAERELLVLRQLDPSFAPALALLSTIYLDDENGFRLAEVTTEYLALATQPALRATLARRLLGLYERVVPDHERAIVAARDWVHAAPFDIEALRALAVRLDPRTDASELIRVLDARADELARRIARPRTDGVGDTSKELEDESLGVLIDSARTAVLYRADVPHAESRLLRALALVYASELDVDRVIAVASELDAHTGVDTLRRAAATYLARTATQVVRPTKARLFLRAADIFGTSIADTSRAFEVLKRAIVECPDDAEVLGSLMEYGTAAGYEEALLEVLEATFEAALDATTARALLRERAGVLYTLERYSDAADAYQRLTSMDPSDDPARRRHRECLSRAARYQDLLIALGQALRHSGYDDMPRRIALLRDIARTWDGRLENRLEGLDAWKKVLAVAPGDPESVEAIARLDGRDAPLGTRRSIVPTLASSASIPPPPPRPPGQSE